METSYTKIGYKNSQHEKSESDESKSLTGSLIALSHEKTKVAP